MNLTAFKSQILEKFQSGIKCKKLSEEYKVKYIEMWKFLKENGAIFRRKILTKDQELNLIYDFKENGFNYNELSKKYKISNSVAGDYIKKAGLKTKERETKFKIDKDFFKNLNDNSLWVLGWFYSDGNVSKSSNTISVCCHKKDNLVLMKIRDLILNENVEKNTYIYTREKLSNFHICSKYLKNDLINLGCIPKKSLIIEYPKILTENWQHSSFLRGVFEGDGCITLKSKRKASAYIDIASGSKSFLLSIQEILKNNFGISSTVKFCPKTKNKKSNCYRLYIVGGREMSAKFLDLIYGNLINRNYLDRKYNRYLKFIELYKNPLPSLDSNKKRYKGGIFLNKKTNILYFTNCLSKFGAQLGLDKSFFANLIKQRGGETIKWKYFKNINRTPDIEYIY